MLAKKRRKENSFYQSNFFFTFFSILILIAISFLAVSIWRINQRRAGLAPHIESLREEIQALKRENEELQAQILRAPTEEFLEREARERLGLKKPGEEAVVILRIIEEEQKQEEKEEKTFWEKILNKLKFW